MKSYGNYPFVMSFFCLILCLRFNYILVWNYSSFSLQSRIQSLFSLFINLWVHEQIPVLVPIMVQTKFQFEATMNASINTSACVSWCTCAHISLEENAGLRFYLYSTFSDNSEMSSKMFIPIYTPISNLWVLTALYSGLQLRLSVLLILAILVEFLTWHFPNCWQGQIRLHVWWPFVLPLLWIALVCYPIFSCLIYLLLFVL